MKSIEDLRGALERIATDFAECVQSPELRVGVDYLPPSGKCVGYEEFSGLLQVAADMWLTTGRFSEEFEEKFPKLWDLRYCALVNSGSSANLAAFAALTSPSLKDRAVKEGDEMVTVACAFPTTVAPAVQYGLKPVFIDVDLSTLNASIESIEAAITDRTRVIMLAHTLGNPYRADQVAEICKKHGIWLIEDCCDALGAKIGNASVGTFGSLATCSFYPAHHITMGEGGAVLTNSSQLYKTVLSIRDWGRDCWCAPGVSNTCGSRFDRKLGDMPQGFDHKYIYSHIGYNLKLTDFQAVLGLAQMKRVEAFVSARKRNHAYLTECLKKLGAEEHFLLPQATPGTDPSWFGYFLVLKEKGRREKVVRYLEENKVGTRLLFGGNLTRQPSYQGVEYSVAEPLVNSDKITEDGFWVGIWPGLSHPHLDYIAEKISEALKN